MPPFPGYQIEEALRQMQSKHIRVGAARSLAAGAMLTLVAAGSAAAAGPGYGGGPPPVVTPTGFSTVVTARTVGKHGGSFRVKYAHGGLKVSVPKNATQTPIQIAITKGSNQTVKGDLPHSLRHYKVLSSFGIEIRNGSSGTSTTKAVTITLNAKDIKKGDLLLAYSPATGKFTEVKGAVITDGKVVVHLKSGESLAVVAPPGKN